MAFFLNLKSSLLYKQSLIRVRPLSQVFGLESSSLRLVKPEKWEFTFVNDYFEGKRNEEIGLYRRTLISLF